MDPQPPSIESIEQAISEYLQAHPHAVDTERGIREWWLQDRRPHASAEIVRAAIAALLAAGQLSIVDLPDGQVAYAASRVRMTRPPDPC